MGTEVPYAVVITVLGPYSMCCRPVLDRRGQKCHFNPHDRRKASDGHRTAKPSASQWPTQVQPANGRPKLSRPMDGPNLQPANGRPKFSGPMAGPNLQPANGRPKFSRPMADPSSAGQWPTQSHARSRGSPITPWSPINAEVRPLPKGNPTLSLETLSNSYFTRFTHLWPLNT